MSTILCTIAIPIISEMNVYGRDYLEGNSLHFAFRATLMAIAMVNFRIKTIQDNVSDIC